MPPIVCGGGTAVSIAAAASARAMSCADAKRCARSRARARAKNARTDTSTLGRWTWHRLGQRERRHHLAEVARAVRQRAGEQLVEHDAVDILPRPFVDHAKRPSAGSNAGAAAGIPRPVLASAA
jgi:hypothetical protein